MDKNNKKGIIIGVLLTVIIIGAIYLILSLTNVVNFSAKQNSSNMKDGDKLSNDNVITKDMLYGTYKWSKDYTNEYGSNLKLNVTLVLNEDGTATYNAGDGYSAEATKGTYKFENNKIVYTREYYNYPNQENGVFDDDNNKTEIFRVIDENTLQNTFNNQVTELKKQEKITKDMLVGTYTWSKNYTNKYGSDMKLKVTLVLNKDGSATYNASDGYAAEATKGTFKLEYNRVIYTREYYNYPNQENSKFDDDNNKTEFFKVIDKNTLQNTFNDQLTELKKQGNVTSNNNSISKFVGTYKYTYSFTQNDVPEDSGCKTINLNATLELKADGTFTYGRGANCSGGESANGTYSINDNKIYLYNQECVEDGNCRQKIELQISESNGVVTIKDNESTSGWKANSMWGSTKLPETILQKVN